MGSNLGEGGFGRVVRGYHRHDPQKRLFAVKIGEQTKSAFSTVGAMSVPDLMREEYAFLRFIYLDGPRPALVPKPVALVHNRLLVMEQVGPSLDKALPKCDRHDHPCRCQRLQQLRLLKAVLLALRRLHGLGVVHRDIKPANICLASPGSDRVVFVDLGLARARLGHKADLRQPAPLLWLTENHRLDRTGDPHRLVATKPTQQRMDEGDSASTSPPPPQAVHRSAADGSEPSMTGPVKAGALCGSLSWMSPSVQSGFVGTPLDDVVSVCFMAAWMMNHHSLPWQSAYLPSHLRGATSKSCVFIAKAKRTWISTLHELLTLSVEAPQAVRSAHVARQLKTLHFQGTRYDLDTALLVAKILVACRCSETDSIPNYQGILDILNKELRLEEEEEAALSNRSKELTV